MGSVGSLVKFFLKISKEVSGCSLVLEHLPQHVEGSKLNTQNNWGAWEKSDAVAVDRGIVQ